MTRTHGEPDAEVAFRGFVASRRHGLLRTAYLMTGDVGRAERVVGRALARARRDWRRPEVAGDATAYVQRVIVELCAPRRSRPADLEEISPPEAWTGGAPDVDESDRIWSGLAALPPRTRGVLVLRCYEGMSVDEIGHVLGRPPEWVSGHVVNGLTRLARALGVPPEEISADARGDLGDLGDLDDLDDLDDGDELFRRWSS